jgi:hypothetical protein
MVMKMALAAWQWRDAPLKRGNGGGVNNGGNDRGVMKQHQQPSAKTWRRCRSMMKNSDQ